MSQPLLDLVSKTGRLCPGTEAQTVDATDEGLWDWLPAGAPAPSPAESAPAVWRAAHRWRARLIARTGIVLCRIQSPSLFQIWGASAALPSRVQGGIPYPELRSRMRRVLPPLPAAGQMEIVCEAKGTRHSDRQTEEELISGLCHVPRHSQGTLPVSFRKERHHTHGAQATGPGRIWHT